MKSALIIGFLALLFWETDSLAQNKPTEELVKAAATPAGALAVHKKIAQEAAQWTIQTFFIPQRDYPRTALVELADKTMQGAMPARPPFEKGGAPVPIRRENTRRGGLVRSILTFNNGERFEAWTFNGSTLVLNRSQKTVFRLVGNSEMSELTGIIKHADFKETDFPELAWMWNQKPVAEVVLHDQRFWIFENRASSSDALEATKQDKRLFAIVSQQTGLPLFAVDGILCSVYSYGTPPSSLSLPADVQDELEKWKLEIATINAAPPRYP